MDETVPGPEPDLTQRLLITICVMLATLLQTLDATIANVALPYMQGGLSASSDQITWVLTAYVVAAAVLTAPVGWLALRFGRKQVFMVCLAGFTAASMACGLATSLPQMVLDRLLQGAFGAALVPLSQATLLDIYPSNQRAMAMSFWGMGVMMGPILGPTLGGYLTAEYSWRFVFFINLPLCIVTILGLLLFMPGGGAKKSSGFDWVGFGTLALGLSACQFMLDRGEALDWFSSGTVITAAVVAGLGFYLFLVHMIMAANPFISRAVFADRNFVASLIILFSVGLVVLSSTALLPPFLEKLANFPVAGTGLIMAPRGIGVMAAMLIAGRLGNSADPRRIIFTGYILLGISLEMIESWTDAVPVNFMVETVTLQGFGLGLVFTPLQTAAFSTLPGHLRTQGAALLSLVRNFGSSMGVAISSAMLARQTIYEHAVLVRDVTPFARPLQSGATVRMLDPLTASGAALLDSMIAVQAQIIAYIDVYKFLMLISIPAMFCLFMLRPADGREFALSVPNPRATDQKFFGAFFQKRAAFIRKIKETQMTNIELVQKFFKSLSAGDLESVTACVDPDATVWHNYDGINASLREAVENICVTVKRVNRFDYVEAQYDLAEDGVTIRHVLQVEIPGGPELRVPIMLHVAVAEGRITRAEEYLDVGSVAPLVAFVQAGG